MTDAVAKLDALSVTRERARFSFVSSARTIVIMLLVICAIMRLHDTPDDGHTMLEAVAGAAAWTMVGLASAVQGVRPRSSVGAMITGFLLGQTMSAAIYLRQAKLRGSIGKLAAAAMLIAPIAFLLDVLAPQPSGPSMVPLPLHHGSSKLSQWLFLYCDRCASRLAALRSRKQSFSASLKRSRLKTCQDSVATSGRRSHWRTGGVRKRACPSSSGGSRV